MKRRPQSPSSAWAVTVAGEVNFSSDAGVIIIHRPTESDGRSQPTYSRARCKSLRAICKGPTTFEPKIRRHGPPEGKNGPLVRSTHRARSIPFMGLAWEHQALLRARHAAGDVTGRGFSCHTRSAALSERILTETANRRNP